MYFIKILSEFIGAISLVISAYYFFLSLFSLYVKKRKPLSDRVRKFAVLIPAHNEAFVVENLVMSLKKLDYPKDRYDIYVVADNCTDNTAEKAEKAGAFVFERKDPDHSGKAYALSWLIEKIKKSERDFDAIAIFDADNIIHPDFLKNVNAKMNTGFKAVQGYLDSKNPFDSPVSAWNAFEFWSTNRLSKLARDNVGISSQLGGTGIALDSEIVEKFGWDPDCLAEDLEFTCKLCLNGYKVGWCHDAVVYDEKPIKMAQSLRQRKRWMQGYSDVAFKYFFRLMGEALRKGSWTMADCALYILQPVNLIILGINSGVGVLLKISALWRNFSGIFTIASISSVTIIALVISAVSFAGLIILLLAMKMDRKLNIRSFLSMATYPVYSITWLPAAIHGIINRNNKDWDHTSHTRNIDLNEIDNI